MLDALAQHESMEANTNDDLERDSALRRLRTVERIIEEEDDMLSSTLVAKILLVALAAVFAFFLFRQATTVDIRPWLAAGVVGCGFGAVILP